jgi:hypothetical protein
MFRFDMAIARAVLSGALLLIAAAAARADGIQPGYWKVTSTAQLNGAAAPAQVKMRCLTPQQAADVDTTFSPEHTTQNATCERVEHDMTGSKLTWRLRCVGAMAMNVAGTFNSIRRSTTARW